MIKHMKSPGGIKGAVGAIRGSFFSVIFFITLVICNLLQTLSLLVLPISKKAFRAINCYIAATWWGWCVIGSEKFYHIRGVYSGHDVPVKENAVVFANHQQMPDVIALLALARKKKRIGDLKWIVKHKLKYVPGMGWGLTFLDCLFLNRNWMSDRKLIERAFSKFRREQIPLWLTSFPEGTRITDAKLAKSAVYAARHGSKPFHNVLYPRTKGFVSSVIALREHLDAIYDVTIAYPQGIPTLWQWVEGWAKEYHVHVQRFPVAVIPTSESEISDWMVQRFQAKDLLMEHFHKFGKFPAA